MDFEIEKNFDGNCWRVAITGEIDIYSSADLKTALNRLMEEKAADIHIDCQHLEYIDSTGLGVLVGVLRRVKSHGKKLYLSHVKANILKLFRITNLDKVFIIEMAEED